MINVKNLYILGDKEWEGYGVLFIYLLRKIIWHWLISMAAKCAYLEIVCMAQIVLLFLNNPQIIFKYLYQESKYVPEDQMEVWQEGEEKLNQKNQR